jgi:hypothetical protein
MKVSDRFMPLPLPPHKLEVVAKKKNNSTFGTEPDFPARHCAERKHFKRSNAKSN